MRPNALMDADLPKERTAFIFSDPAGRRWPRFRLMLLLGGIVVFLASVFFVQTLFVTPQLRLPFSLRQLKGQLKALQKANPAGQLPPNVPLWEKFIATRAAARKQPSPSATAPPASARKSAGGEVRMAFYTNGDPYSYKSLEEHAAQLTHVCPEWFSLVDGLGNMQIDADVRLPKLAAAKGIALMPLLTNLVGDAWKPEAVENLAHGPADRQERFIQNLLTNLRNAKAAGVVLDWEQVDPAYQDDITKLLNKMADALHAEGRQLWLCVQPGQDLDYIDFENISEKIDRFVALLFDETSEEDSPGPIASRQWFESWLHALLKDADPQQWIVALGSYGYDWTSGAHRAELISFPEAMSRASNAGVEPGTVAPPDHSSDFYYEDANKEHTVWFLDVVSFLNELHAVRDQQAGGFAIYRLGTEDSAIWDAINFPRKFQLDGTVKASLETLLGNETITDVGEGEIVSVDETRADGARKIELGPDGYLSATYLRFPEFPTLYHQGAGGEHQVALTFDDGPDPKWTPQVLDLLKANGVKAAFFLVGVNAEKYPDLVRRIVAEGHEIGNHTYYHPNLAICWPEHIRLELNATQLLLETITGRSTTLFRPPYNADTSPSSLAELTPLRIANELNYLVVLENIDPQDWARPGADVILQRIKQQRRDGSIILLHDAGGDRAQTIEALPRIIDWLRTRGDTIVPLSTLIGSSRDAVMPPLGDGQRIPRFVSSAGFRVFHAVEEFLWAFMIVATALIVIRTLVVIFLATRFRRHPAPPGFAPAVSVLIAAYNEEKVIAATLRAVLANDHPGPIEVLVVDDGSSDETTAEVEKIAQGDARVRIVRQPNRGKAVALQRGLSLVQHDFIVFLDADTHLQSDTLRLLVQPLSDEAVVAVSGHAKVGNLRSFIARCQALEYTCGFNLDRRAYDRWNCITVVPGAISALRRSAIAQAGGLSLDTLAEDTDLTLALHKDRGRIVYTPEAIAWTEAPETLRTLARQRFRWAYGTLQCLWKHRDKVFNWRYRALAWFSLPSVWFFQILLVALTPLVDFFLLASLPFGAWRAVLPFFVIFVAMDVILATLACLLERESILRAWRIIPMRLIYRPLLSYVIWKAILRALKGAWVGWGKLERTASVPVRV
jgi:cellulose synthase/poly-beta-1,6-N-acetylglucosamine synthase-like glycosyltransferase/peptidoglycan/xylan/chitin deacetylase (PgdA/CDA1 family)/spore germination protein YaaH